MTNSPTPFCITDCSILNQSTCQPMMTKQVVMDQEEISAHLWYPDGCYNASLFKATEGYRQFQQFSILMSQLMIAVGVLGLCGNIFSIFVLARKEMKNCFNHILIAINVCDSLHLLFAILDAIRNSFGEYYPVFLLEVFPYFHYPFYRISLLASIYLILSVAIERYTAVCRPHHYREVQADSKRSLLYILPSLGLAIAVNCSRFFETETAKLCVDLSACGPCHDGPVWAHYVKPTNLRLDKRYIIYYQTWTWVLSTGIIPLIMLMFLNLKILLSLRRLRSRLQTKVVKGNKQGQVQTKRLSQQSKDINLAFILVSTVFMFFFCHLPRLVTSIYEAANIHSILECKEKGQDKTPLWFMYVTAAVQLLMVLNASVNFPICFFAGQSFRSTTLQMIRCGWQSIHTGKEDKGAQEGDDDHPVTTAGEEHVQEDENENNKNKLEEVFTIQDTKIVYNNHTGQTITSL